MDKPFLTFDEQIEKLKTDYKLTIDNDAFATEALSSLSYYDLINGYQTLYMPDGKYKFGTTIEELYTTHIFNKNIQGVLFKYATYVENSFKTLLSYIVANNLTEDHTKYLRIENYKRSRTGPQRERLQRTLETFSHTATSCRDTPTQFYRETKNHIPPWILFRNVSFSDTTNLFSFLKRNEQEDFFNLIPIFNTTDLEFNDKINITIDALNLVRKFRNTIAHNLNFLTYRDSRLNNKANLLFRNNLVLEKELHKTRTDVWAMVISIVILLNNKYLAQNFLAELQSFMHYNDNLAKIYCEVTGIPLDFENRIKRYIKELQF